MQNNLETIKVYHITFHSEKIPSYSKSLQYSTSNKTIKINIIQIATHDRARHLNLALKLQNEQKTLNKTLSFLQSFKCSKNFRAFQVSSNFLQIMAYKK